MWPATLFRFSDYYYCIAGLANASSEVQVVNEGEKHRPVPSRSSQSKTGGSQLANNDSATKCTL